MNAWQTHQHYFNNYVKHYEKDNGKARKSILESKRRTDFDVLKEAHKFLREGKEGESMEEETNNKTNSKYQSYSESLAIKYYSQLFKEFACIDLKHYKTSKVALRWRTEDEVLNGIGHFTCSNIRCPFHLSIELDSELDSDVDIDIEEENKGKGNGNGKGNGKRKRKSEDLKKEQDLKPWEINFAYLESESSSNDSGTSEKGKLIHKNALVKVVLCPKCSKKLKYSRAVESSSSSSSSSKSNSTRNEGSSFSNKRETSNKSKSNFSHHSDVTRGSDRSERNKKQKKWR